MTLKVTGDWAGAFKLELVIVVVDGTGLLPPPPPPPPPPPHPTAKITARLHAVIGTIRIPRRTDLFREKANAKTTAKIPSQRIAQLEWSRCKTKIIEPQREILVAPENGGVSGDCIRAA